MQNYTLYTYEDFWLDCYSFNSIAGKDKDTSFKDLCKQFKLIAEELRETLDGLCTNNPKEVLDGTVDVLVTAIGMIQKLESLGFNVRKALQNTAENNLSKFPQTETIAIETAEMYDRQSIDVKVEYNSEYDVFVVKDHNDKIRKPSDFQPNNLLNCLPDEFKNSFPDWKPFNFKMELSDD